MERLVIGALLAVVCLFAAPADAQTSATGISARGLFGASAQAPRKRKVLDLSMGLAEAYGNDADEEESHGNSRSGRALHSRIQADLRYAQRVGKAQLSLTAGSAVRYYASLNDLATVQHRLAANVSAPIGRRTQIRVNQGVFYAPEYILTLFAPASPGGSEETNPFDVDPASWLGDIASADFSISQIRSLASTTAVGLSRSLSRASSIGVEYSRSLQTGDALGLTSQRVGARYHLQLRRDMGVHVGYAYEHARHPLAVAHGGVLHDIDVGIDYSRALSIPLSRGTRLAFTTGSGVTRTVRGADFAMLGGMSLTHTFGRQWRLGFNMWRDLRFAHTFGEPVLSNSADVQTNGAFGRRVQVSASLAFTGAAVGRTGQADYDAIAGKAQLRVALSRYIAFDAQYAAYRYHFAEGTTLPLGWRPSMTQHAPRFGLTLWLPLAR